MAFPNSYGAGSHGSNAADRSALGNRSAAKIRATKSGCSHGTNNLAEIMAYVQAMLWINRERLKARTAGWDIHVITDSQYVATSGPRHWGDLKEHRELWLLLHGYSRRGVRLHWHWNRRDQLALNQLGHELANIARRRMAKQPDTADPYECEPAE
jgi:ribonuclease HI